MENNAVHKTFLISADEREAFLKGNSMPSDSIESYIWFSFENASGGVVYLFCDELDTAAEMAGKAVLKDLAARIRAAVG